MNSRVTFLLVSGVVLAIGCNRAPPSRGSVEPAAKTGNESAKEAPGPTGGAPKSTVVGTDLDKLQGAWVWRAFERAGQEYNSPFHKALANGEVLTFEGDKLQKQMMLPGTNDTVTIPGTVKIDPTTAPKNIDFTLNNPGAPAHGKTTKGVYELNGDTLRLAWATGDKDDRPKSVGTKAGDNIGVNIYMRKK